MGHPLAHIKSHEVFAPTAWQALFRAHGYVYENVALDSEYVTVNLRKFDGEWLATIHWEDF